MTAPGECSPLKPGSVDLTASLEASSGRAIQQANCFLQNRIPRLPNTRDCFRSDVPRVAGHDPGRRNLTGTGIDLEAEGTMASPRCTRLAGGPRTPVAPAAGRNLARTGTGRIAQAARRQAALVFARAGHTACVVAAGPGTRVAPRTGSAAEESSVYAGAHGRRRECSRPGRCGGAARCALARGTGAARMRPAAGTWREARSHCRFLSGRHSCIQSFGSAEECASVSIYMFSSALYIPGSLACRRTEAPDCPPNMCATPPIMEPASPPELCDDCEAWPLWKFWGWDGLFPEEKRFDVSCPTILPPRPPDADDEPWCCCCWPWPPVLLCVSPLMTWFARPPKGLLFELWPLPLPPCLPPSNAFMAMLCARRGASVSGRARARETEPEAAGGGGVGLHRGLCRRLDHRYQCPWCRQPRWA